MSISPVANYYHAVSIQNVSEPKTSAFSQKSFTLEPRESSRGLPIVKGIVLPHTIPFTIDKPRGFDAVQCKGFLGKSTSAAISDIAKKCLAELAVSFIIGATTLCFIASHAQGVFLVSAIAIQTICNAALRYAAAREIISSELASRLCIPIFCYITALNLHMLLQETGHAIAAQWMFQNASPKITINPYMYAITEFNTAHLTAWGQNIGKSGALLFVTIMGPLFSLAISAVAIAVGLTVQKKFQELGKYLTRYGRADFYNQSLCALRVMLTSPPANARNFVYLKECGIHPLIPFVAILTTQFFIKPLS
ncbi:MAG TPA: hypothetical protein VLE95_00635 [Chlamydiales bacterium]|nr:hypothetical protein [Chlamydiales bacterium]